MTIEPRTVTAFIGPSGCGNKSTFLRTLNRMHEVIPGAYVEGSVKIDGDDLYGAGVDPVLVAVRSHGVPAPEPVPHDVHPRQRAGGVKLNNKRMSNVRVRRHRRALAAGREPLERGQGPLEKPGMGLSGGQQQRLCIAVRSRCSGRPAHGRAVLALDPISTLAIEDLLIEELKKDFTIVIVTHNMTAGVARQRQDRLFNIAGTVHRQAHRVRRHGDDVLEPVGAGDRGLRLGSLRLICRRTVADGRPGGPVHVRHGRHRASLRLLVDASAGTTLRLATARPPTTTGAADAPLPARVVLCC